MTSLFLKDRSLLAVLISNLFSIVMAAVQGWQIGEIMWVYWAQSVVIGLSNFQRIRSLKSFSTENFKINGKQPDESPVTKRKTAFFFLVHYGFFHVAYFIFLNIQHPLGELPEYDWVFLSLCILGFIGSHFYSYRYNATRDFRDRKPNIGSLMFYPYLRILPMHLTIVIGAGSTGVASLLMFMMLKTLADMGMHVVEHRLFRQSAQI